MSLNKILVIMLAFALIFSACAKKAVVPVKEEVQSQTKVSPPPLEEVEKPKPAPVEKKPEKIVLEDVFFDFDKYDIKDQYRKVLARDAEILINHPDLNLLVEGHCDERGTNEYNLALGEKRAKAVVDFLVAYGLDRKRISMISYGEERPFDPGHNEAAWAKNRRAHLVIKK